MEVTSEILPHFQLDSTTKPIICDENVVSKFNFRCPVKNSSGELQPISEPEKDADGDYIVTRRESTSLREVTLLFEHRVSTELKLVGLQIWRGALLLADYLIHDRSELENKTVLELGAGVGLTSAVAGIYAKQIICTDVDRGDILKLLKYNMERNKSIINSQVLVEEIDFFNREWTPAMCEKMKEVSVVLAADVIYDNDITEAFIKTVTKILDIPPKKTLYLAMEKRYVFTLADLDSVAPCYEYLLTCLEEVKRKEPFSRWKIEQVTLDFPQYFIYERVKELIMFRISA